MAKRNTLVDSSVLIDVLSHDQEWYAWSTAQIERAFREGVVAVNPIIYAEVSPAFESLEALNEALPEAAYQRLPLPWVAAFAAGRAFAQYRHRGGQRPSPLPDFYIGAHAAVAGLTLLTRDATRFRTYFPTLDIIAP